MTSSTKYNYPSKALPPNTITLGIRASTYEVWEDTNIQPITAHVSVTNSALQIVGRQ